MYYRLKKPWAFRGWKLTPYAVQAQYGADKHKKPYFFGKKVFLELLDCNGEEVVDLSAFSAKGQQVVKEFLSHGMMKESAQPLGPMESWQRVCRSECPARKPGSSPRIRMITDAPWERQRSSFRTAPTTAY